MLPNLVFISSIIFLQFSSVFAAPPIAQVASTNNILEEIAVQVTEDVNAVTAVNGLFQAQRVPKDFQTFADDFKNYTVADDGIAGSNDPGTEDTVTESFNSLTGALAKLMNNLVSKKKVLVLYGQQNAIYTQLVALRGAFLGYAIEIAPLLQDASHRTEINDLTTNALGPIEAAKVEFAPNNKPI